MSLGQGKAAQAMQCLALMAYATALATGIVLIVKKQQIFNVIMSVSVLLASKSFSVLSVLYKHAFLSMIQLMAFYIFIAI